MKTPGELNDDALSDFIGKSHAKMRSPEVSVEGVLERVQRFNDLHGALTARPIGPALIYHELATGNLSFRLVEQRMVVGRQSASCALAFPSATEMSRTHFEITAEQGLHVLRDLESRNGTFLNDSKESIAEPVVLNAGDIIFAGGVLFAFTGE